jgi:urea transport system permease protein
MRFAGGLVSMLLAAVMGLAAMAASARAAPFDDAMALFANDDFTSTANAVAALGTSGDPRAQPVLEALNDGNLLFASGSPTIYIQDAAGKLTDAATGKPASVADPSTLSPVRLSNRVRNAINAALGALNLLAPDPGKRRAAAEAVFASRDAAALPALEKAIAAEKDAGVKQELLQARAAVMIGGAAMSDADLLDAIAAIRGRGDNATLSLLSSILPDASPAVRAAADSAIASVQQALALWGVVQNAWYGLSLGSVLLLAAIGLAITFGVMGVINMAHGEMVMLGAYTTFVVQEVIRAHAPGLFDWSLAFAIPLAFLVSGAVGVAIERGIIRFLYGRPLETLLATWGVSLILQQTVRTIFGPTNQDVGSPSWMSGAFNVGGISITNNRLWIIVFAGLVFCLLLAVLKLTRFGLQMRAVTQNRAMASAMGIRTPWVDAFTFGLGSGIAGMAGVALSQIDNVSPNLGQNYIVDSFMVVVFGGVGNLWGTLVGALTLGEVNKFLEPYAGAVLGKIAILIFIILFVQRRPRGLFALKGRAVEA